jgi:glycosyltransferase involved in cell wall biosynthesis
VLAEYHDVTLITHQPVDLSAIGSRFNIDLSRVKLRCVEDLPFDLMAPITAEYDLFINGSHFSFVPSRAKHSIMFVYFPVLGMKSWAPSLRQWVGRILLRELRVPQFREGFYMLQELGRGRYRWSAKEATVEIPFSGWKRDTRMQIVAGSFRPDGWPPVPVRVMCGDQVLAEASLNTTMGNYENIDFVLPRTCIEDGKARLTLTSDTFFARDAGVDMYDFRQVGIAVAAVRTRSWRYYLYELVFERLFPEWGLRLHGIPEDPSLEHIRTYDLLCPISRFVSHWVTQSWGLDGRILYPPVDVGDFQPGKKRRMILSVGRFFPHSHEKKFPEMVQAFAELARQELQSWELHLAGGVAEDPLSQDYYRKVQSLAEGLPVVLHPNVDFEELRQLYSQATLYWHATGYGENEARHPEKLEHFGITPVEAMAAGCVPIVYGKGGPAEIVEHDKSGFHWETLDELKGFTRAAITDPSLVVRLQAGAIQRASHFSEEEFAVRLLQLVVQVVSRQDEVCMSPHEAAT